MNTLYVPGATIKFQQMDELSLFMGLDRVKEYLASEVAVRCPRARGVESGASEDFIDLLFTFSFDPSFVLDKDKLYNNIVTWARRSRLRGLRGNRLCVVSEVCVQGHVASVFVKLGTAVVYNERHVTLNTLSTASDVVAHLSTLVPFVPVKPHVKVEGMQQELDLLWYCNTNGSNGVAPCSGLIDVKTTASDVDNRTLTYAFQNLDMQKEEVSPSLDLHPAASEMFSTIDEVQDKTTVFEEETIQKVCGLARSLLDPAVDSATTQQLLKSIRDLLDW